ncbi:MAG: PfkB family carbohydrate kinase [Chthoniobacterales bacterium]
MKRIGELLQAFRKKRLLVIGDVMLDEFIWGKVSRISPEAPVPVVEVSGESAYPGGAANVARNLKEFCDEAHVMGIIGTDRHGAQLRQLMLELGLDLRCLFEDADYKTIVKTRIVARQQQLVRVDREQLTAPASGQMEHALSCLEKILPEVDAVIFEDYAKGLLGQEFVTRATALIVDAGKIVTADPNPKNPLHWNSLTAIKPNRSEAFRCAGIEENDPDFDFTASSRLSEVSRKLLEKWHTQHLLITLGENGMVLFERDAEPYHIPTRAQEVYDVSGAGDTAIALFTLALASGATAREAAEISNHASSVVVGKLGTATLTPAELLASFERHSP